MSASLEPQSASSLAKGSQLTQESFDNFVERLRHDCVGEGVADHGTADALFIVQAKRRITGLDTDYTEQWLIHHEDRQWLSPQAYWDDLDEEEQAALDAKVQEDGTDCGFLGLGESDQWHLLGELNDHYLTGWDDQWEYVNSHFTKDAAEAFIRRKKHDYPLGMRVWVDAQSYCWEFNAIKEALIKGSLVLAGGLDGGKE